MKTTTLKYVGKKLYRGYDAGRSLQVLAFPGSTHDLSAQKADQVLKDFPSDWQVVSAPEQASAVPAEAPAPAELSSTPEHAPKAGGKKKGSRR